MKVYDYSEEWNARDEEWFFFSSEELNMSEEWRDKTETAFFTGWFYYCIWSGDVNITILSIYNGYITLPTKPVDSWSI